MIAFLWFVIVTKSLAALLFLFGLLDDEAGIETRIGKLISVVFSAAIIAWAAVLLATGGR